MTQYVGKCIDLNSLPSPVVKGANTYLATDGYGRLQTVAQSDTAALTDGTQRTQIISEDGYSVDVYSVGSGIYALKNQEVLIPGAEDNTNNVLHINHRPLANSTNALSYYQTTSLATNGVIKASAGKIFKISGILVPSDNSGATHYIQLYNASSVPADTAVPKFVYSITAGANTVPIRFEYEFANGFGIYNDTGITWAISSTLATKTLTTIATAWIQVSYI